MSRKKILLVDDSATMLMLEKFVLRNDPYVLLTATSGEEAVEKAAREKPDLIVLDAAMPGMSGFEARRRIREHDGLEHVPIVMVERREEVEGDGGADRVTKPIHAVELLAKVRALLGGGATEDDRRPSAFGPFRR